MQHLISIKGSLPTCQVKGTANQRPEYAALASMLVLIDVLVMSLSSNEWPSAGRVSTLCSESLEPANVARKPWTVGPGKRLIGWVWTHQSWL